MWFFDLFWSWLVWSKTSNQGREKVGSHSRALFSFSSLAIYKFFLPNCLLEPLSVTGVKYLPSFPIVRFSSEFSVEKFGSATFCLVRKQKGCEVSWGRRWQKWAVLFCLDFVYFLRSPMAYYPLGWTSFSLLRGERVPLKVIPIKDNLIWWKMSNWCSIWSGNL